MVSIHVLVLAAALTANQDLELLDFQAQWCGPCRAMAPTIERLEQAGYPVRRVDIDQHGFRQLERALECLWHGMAGSSPIQRSCMIGVAGARHDQQVGIVASQL